MYIFDLDLARTRPEAERHGNLYHTLDMVYWLRKSAEVPNELGWAFLGSWVGLLRQWTLRCMREEKPFFDRARQGAAYLIAIPLGEQLAPFGLEQDIVHQQFSVELGLPPWHVHSLLGLLRAKVEELDAEGKAFEPVGWVVSSRRLRHDEPPANPFQVLFWHDFLSPKAAGPRVVVSGVGFEEAERDSYAWREARGLYE